MGILGVEVSEGGRGDGDGGGEPAVGEDVEGVDSGKVVEGRRAWR